MSVRWNTIAAKVSLDCLECMYLTKKQHCHTGSAVFQRVKKVVIATPVITLAWQ